MNTDSIQSKLSVNAILHGGCIQVMRQMPANSVDFILTDPPYLVNYHDRDGRTIQNDAKADWLKPAMAEAYRVLKQNRRMLCFYGWTKVDMFFDTWKHAGFQPVGHLVFRKSYASKSRFLRYQHEQAYLLAKGRPPLPKQTLGDVMDMPYSGNKLHPTQKPVIALAPLVRSFSLPGDLVLDPFAGSESQKYTVKRSTIFWAKTEILTSLSGNHPWLTLELKQELASNDHFQSAEATNRATSATRATDYLHG